MSWKGLLVFLLIVPLPAQAGFLDSVINNAKQATENVINKSVGAVTENSNPQSDPVPDSAKPPTHMTGEQKLADAQAISKGVWRATLHFHPEVLDDETWLKNSVGKLYPQEASNDTSNEFTWQKNEAELKARILKEIADPPMTFNAAPWTNARGGRVMLGDYDFTRQAFKISSTDVKPPYSVGDIRPFAEKLYRAIYKIGWLSVPAEQAEGFVNSGVFNGGRRLYAEYDFTVTGTKKYESHGRIGLITTFSIGPIKLYAYVNKVQPNADNGIDDYLYIGSLIVPQVLYQESKQSSKAQAKAKAPATAPVATPKLKQVAKQGVKPPPKVDPLAGVGPYLRVEKGQPYGPDIISLRLGMTPDEADKLIRAYKQPREVVIGKAPSPYVSARAYPLEPGDEAISVLTLASPAGERVAGYVRTVYLNPGQHPTQVALGSSLEKKYGMPTYNYEVPGNFERRWLTTAQGELGEGDQYGHVKGLDHCEGAAKSYSGAKVFSGKKQGYPYIWMLPWQQQGSPAGTLWYLKPGNSRIDQPNRCGAVLVARYDDGSSTVTGPTLTLTLFDTPWLVEEVSKKKSADKAQGAKGLNF